MSNAPENLHLGAVPLFPLPNVVLFPGAILPLHIFEQRYKEMTADTLSYDRVIAMALLKTGWEKSYYGKPAIEPIVCVGEILTHEALPDGNYNFLLRGSLRARLVRELKRDCSYRVAELALLDEQPVMEIDLQRQRRRLVELLEQGGICTAGMARQFRQLLSGPMPTAQIADLLAFNLLDSVDLKQSLLADVDVTHRVDRVVLAVDELKATLSTTHDRWGGNPSLN